MGDSRPIRRVEFRSDGSFVVEYLEAPGWRPGDQNLEGVRKEPFRIRFDVGSVIAIVVGVLLAAAAISEVPLAIRIVMFAATFLTGIPLIGWWEIPKVRPRPWLRVAALCLWALFIGTLSFSIIAAAEKTDIAISLDATLMNPVPKATPPAQGNNVYYLPSDTDIETRLGQEAVQLGYEVGSSPVSLSLKISNNGPKAWSAFKIPITIHYVIRHGIPLNLDWGARGSIDQSFLLSNGTWSPTHPDIPIFLSPPVNSYSSVTVTLINTSIAYAALEFPERVQVQEVGSDRFLSVPLSLSGIQMLAPTLLRVEMLPPWRSLNR